MVPRTEAGGVKRDPSCPFCRIVSGELRSQVFYRDDRLVSFRDATPQAPFHALVVPVMHVPSLDDLVDEDGELIGRIILHATRLAREQHLAERGYRLVWNCGAEAGQSVFHVHLHVLGGRPMSWPPG